MQLMATNSAWSRALHDPSLRDLPYKIETNEYGQLAEASPIAPEICIEVISASNTRGRMRPNASRILLHHHPLRPKQLLWNPRASPRSSSDRARAIHRPSTPSFRSSTTRWRGSLIGSSGALDRERRSIPRLSCMRPTCASWIRRRWTGRTASTSSRRLPGPCDSSSSIMRGGVRRRSGAGMLRLDEVDVPVEEQAGILLALDEALSRLSRVDERLGRIVECRFFGGLSELETAQVLGVSDRTIRRDWNKAKAWLYLELSSEEVSSEG